MVSGVVEEGPAVDAVEQVLDVVQPLFGMLM